MKAFDPNVIQQALAAAKPIDSSVIEQALATMKSSGTTVLDDVLAAMKSLDTRVIEQALAAMKAFDTVVMDDVLAAMKPIDFDRLARLLDSEIVEWASSDVAAEASGDPTDDLTQLQLHLDAARLWLIWTIAQLRVAMAQIPEVVDSLNSQLGRYRSLVDNLIWLCGVCTIIRHVIR